MNKVETYNRKNILSQIKWLIKMVRYLLGKENSEGGSGIQSIQEGDNISIDNTDPQNPVVSSTGGTPTLAEVLAVENNAGEEVIQFEYDDGLGIPKNGFIGFIDIQTGMGTQKELSFGTPGFRVTPSGFHSDLMGHKLDFVLGTEEGGVGNFNSYYIDSSGGATRGLVGSTYFGANYDDNTYVQKKYVDDFYKTIPGYDEEATQILKNINGVLTWVTEKVG